MAKTAAERQAESRLRRKQAGMVFVQLVLPARDHKAIKKAALIAEMDLKEWMNSVLMRAAKENRPGR